jgi:hypothetical protein
MIPVCRGKHTNFTPTIDGVITHKQSIAGAQTHTLTFICSSVVQIGYFKVNFLVECIVIALGKIYWREGGDGIHHPNHMAFHPSTVRD